MHRICNIKRVILNSPGVISTRTESWVRNWGRGCKEDVHDINFGTAWEKNGNSGGPRGAEKAGTRLIATHEGGVASTKRSTSRGGYFPFQYSSNILYLP